VNTNGNYLDPAAWKKMPNPVFASLVSTSGSVYGPGHCSFTKSLDGTEDWIFYHAAKYSGAGWNRNIRMQAFSWSSNGYPNFGPPFPAGVPLAIPSGDAYTAPRFETVATQPDGTMNLRAIAPLPLETNQWRLESSGDLSHWLVLTNVPGLQFSVNVVDGPL